MLSPFIQHHIVWTVGYQNFRVMNKDDNRKKKESVVDLSRFIDQRIRVKFQGGREACGILKGYDTLLNIVLDDVTEFLRDPDDPFRLTGDTRQLGLIVCRGPAITIVGPADGVEEIENPFAQNEMEV